MLNRARTLMMAAVCAAAALGASQADAHARLLASSPAADAVLKAPPKTITLTFNEKLAPAFSRFELTMTEHGGMKVPVKTTVSKDRKSITGVPQGQMASGAYKIAWTAAGADGHRMTGEVRFKIG